MLLMYYDIEIYILTVNITYDIVLNTSFYRKNIKI